MRHSIGAAVRLIATAAILTCSGGLGRAQVLDYSTLSYDGLATFPSGIRGHIVTAGAVAPGYSQPNTGTILNLTTGDWSLFPPGQSGNSVPYGPSRSGNLIVGMDRQSGVANGYLYNMNSGRTTAINFPGAVSTVPHSIFAGEVVGSYWSVASTNPNGPAQGFSYNALSGIYNTISYPGAYDTELYGIWGNVIAGTYRAYAGASPSGFLYNQLTGKFISYIFPGATSTTFHGISGGGAKGTLEVTGVVNVNGQQQGFELKLGAKGREAWTPIVIPGAAKTSGNSIKGNTIVGLYSTSKGGSYQGFSATVSMRGATTVAASCATQIIGTCDPPSAPVASGGGGGGGASASAGRIPDLVDEFRYW